MAKKVQEDFEPLDEEPAAIVEKAPVEMTADDLADDEWGPSKDKGKKGKKGKGKKGKAQNEEEEAAPDNISASVTLNLDPSQGADKSTPTISSAPQVPSAEPQEDGDNDADEDADAGPKVLTKKEKEKLKKEREKVVFLKFGLSVHI